MRRWVALAAAVLAVSVPVAASPAAAQAGPPDPANAIKRQLRNEHGVRTAETVRLISGKKSEDAFRIRAAVRLGPSGAAATDFTWRDVPKGGAGKPESHRVIRVGKDVYFDRGQYRGPVPDGKTWIRRTSSGGFIRYIAPTGSLQPINVYDQSVMKAVLKRSTTERVSGGFLYRGTISYRELSKASRSPHIDRFSGRTTDEKSKGKISWRLWADRAGLPTRLITTDAMGEGKSAMVMWIDTRYTDWGTPLVIDAPPADEVIDENDLPTELPEPPTVTPALAPVR
ncbi:hypothetical protein [Microtetraspora niveoalba]|uniref:hypothetical protein n=1 Tax=Microtetraspora niveoalba TaxID=46175 RepID=UPI000834B3D8|nr:hypothetical protein [Microtetraspora niveoalba]